MAVLKVIDDGACPGRVNMERDAALLAAHDPSGPPVLRLYRWSPPAVSIGYNQDLASFDAAAVAAAGYDLVQRPTGGRAILHAEELTYAVVGASPSPLFGSSLHDTYMKINEALVEFLRGLGLAAEISDGESRAEARGLVCFRSAGRHEISVGGRKIVGSAQRRRGDVFLQHGSILAGPRHLDLTSFLGAPGGRPAADPAALAAATTDLAALLGRELAPADLDGFMPGLADAFANVWGLDPEPADFADLVP